MSFRYVFLPSISVPSLIALLVILKLGSPTVPSSFTSPIKSLPSTTVVVSSLKTKSRPFLIAASTFHILEEAVVAAARSPSCVLWSNAVLVLNVAPTAAVTGAPAPMKLFK